MNKLTVENVDFSYGKKVILKNISFNIENGLTGLLGKNGAGKTTLIKILVTLFKPSKGSILFNDCDYNVSSNEIRKRLGYLQQDFNMYKNLTGLDYLKFVAKMRDVNNIDDEIFKICEQLNLNKYIKGKIGTYSGGIKRRLGIAQAIIGDTKLIVLDEPTIGLDPEERNEFRKIIKRISRDKIVIMSTHITEDIEFLCDKLIILKDSTVQFVGSVDEFIDNNKDNIYEEVVNQIRFNEIMNDKKVISYNGDGDKISVKYIEKNDGNSNYAKNMTLQDAYINFLEE